MSNNQSFEEKYPNLSDFVYYQGKIEIGYDYNTNSFVIAYDEGGTVYEGKDKYEKIEDALADLEAGITQYLEEYGIDLKE
ncbi:hypothetical protein [Geminocystis sp. NIES-3709]|uniref:hypothetical protein n=1 Tax=Geminocystis sp. NIES-3709 TaxID=1617448 RepID=UPI0005FCB978|nr:hypothetical protein [Geminocystis sp. NIES-3709]BAQ67137.1 hypothetical protein GM3709_3902 [Geminocystis sp. NIES-3709]